MTISDALRIVRQASSDAPQFEVVLACGFTPLHLQTFLNAHLQELLPGRKVTIRTGLFGNLVETLASLESASAEGVAIALEWADLDPRLGFRGAGRWSTAGISDILGGVRLGLQRVADAIQRISSRIRCVVSLPTLPLPPLFPPPGWQASEFELLLNQLLSDFAVHVSACRGVLVVNERRLAEESAPATRLDLKSDLLLGLPYSLSHADCLAGTLARLILPKPPRKGVISDLDHTLWHGIAGEAGPDGVCWDLTGHAQLHGLYQNLLAALSEQGVLVGIASKNDPALVERVFQREDLLLTAKHVFPIEAHWNAKSGSVARILRTWNIAADSVVFVDDSPMELAEVAAEHPGIECLQFPAGDYAAGLALLRKLRDLCGKERLSEDDGLRLESIRRNAEFHAVSESGGATETFLKQLDARIVFDFYPNPGDGRILELVNKTNQFNLNGIRYTEAEWQRLISRPGAAIAAVSYEDKFGPLGKIAVIQGCVEGTSLRIGTWVMSCRAFARRIEHQCLRVLFDSYDVAQLTFDFTPTSRNGPLQEFWTATLGTRPVGTFDLSRERFDKACPALYHEIFRPEISNANG